MRGRAAGVASDVAAAVRPKLGKSNLLILFADTYNFEAEATIEALGKELPGVTIAGGGASEDGSIGETFVFCGDTISSNAVSGMLLSGDFELTLANTIACGLIGTAHRVTAARDNILIELDDRPAYEVFTEAAGPLADDLRRALGHIFVAIPIYENATTIERGQFVVRNIVGASEEHGVIAVSFQPKVGDTIGFVLRDAERSREDLKATLDDVNDRLNRNLNAPPAFGLYFNCVSRGSGLYNIPGHDSAYIRRALGPIPIAGFFTGFRNQFARRANVAAAVLGGAGVDIGEKEGPCLVIQQSAKFPQAVKRRRPNPLCPLPMNGKGKERWERPEEKRNRRVQVPLAIYGEG